MENTKLLAGKKGIIMGLANDHSMAWGIAKLASENGAELAFNYLGEMMEKRVRPLAESLDAKLILPCNVSNEAEMDTFFAEVEKKMGKIDFVLHAIAFSNKEELSGRYCDTTKANFLQTMEISCFSLTDMAKRASKIMNEGGSIITLTYFGGEKVMPNYNVMGVAKAALDCSVKYLAADLGPMNIRVNAISAGPIKTLAASGIDDFKAMLKWNEIQAPLHRNMTMDDVSRAALYLFSDLSSGVTGEIHHVDCGYSTVGMPPITPDSARKMIEMLDYFAKKDSAV